MQRTSTPPYDFIAWTYSPHRLEHVVSGTNLLPSSGESYVRIKLIVSCTCVPEVQKTGSPKCRWCYGIVGLNMLYAMQEDKYLTSKDHTCPRAGHESIWASGGKAPLIMNVDITWRRVVSITLWPLYPPSKYPRSTHTTDSWVDPRAGVDTGHPSGIEARFL